MQVPRRSTDEHVPLHCWDLEVGGKGEQLIEEPLSVQDAQADLPVRRFLSNGGRTTRGSIINAISEGGYVPTSTQLLAAELAEDLYGAEITFVQADPSSFREVVQKLTGKERLITSCEAHQNQATPLTVSLTLGRGPATSSVTDNKSAHVERTSSAGASGSGRGQVQLQAFSGPGPRRNSTLKLLERRHATKKLELKQLLGTSSSLRSTCNSYVNSTSALSPVSPFSVHDIFENSTTPTSRRNSSYSYSPVPVSPTTFPHSPMPLSSQASSEVRQVIRRNSGPYSPSSVPVSPTTFTHSTTSLRSQECSEIRQLIDERRISGSYSPSSVPASPTTFPHTPMSLGSEECSEIRELTYRRCDSGPCAPSSVAFPHRLMPLGSECFEVRQLFDGKRDSGPYSPESSVARMGSVPQLLPLF